MYLTKRDNFYNAIEQMFRSPFFNSTSDTPVTNSRLMRTNIQETDSGYALSVELPGFSKDNIQAELKDGYLNITATKSESSTDESAGKYIRKECFEGTCKRSFYVGDYLHEDDIKASYENGILALQIPKEPEPIPEQPKLITIQ